MDNLLLVVIVLAALLVALVGWLVASARRSRVDDDRLAGEMARLVDGLEARLKAIAETQTTQQQAVAERLHAQERFLDKALETRLGDITKKVGDGLASSQTRTLETMGRLEARLAVIDRAQASIRELGVQMVGLQDILSNKQARGAFGEIALNDLVRRRPAALGLRVPEDLVERAARGLPAGAARSARGRLRSTPSSPSKATARFTRLWTTRRASARRARFAPRSAFISRTSRRNTSSPARPRPRR